MSIFEKAPHSLPLSLSLSDDCLWVLYRSPSLALLQLLTTPQPGGAAILSMGVACSTLLADPLQQQLALQLLDSFVGEGRGKHTHWCKANGNTNAGPTPSSLSAFVPVWLVLGPQQMVLLT